MISSLRQKNSNSLVLYPNPFVLLTRFIMTISCFSLLIFCVQFIYEEFSSFNNYKDYIGSFALIFVFSLATVMFGKLFVQNAKVFRIDLDGLSEFDLLTMRRKKYSYNKIKGYQTLIVPYSRLPDRKQITMCLLNEKEIEIMQTAFINFNQIENYLIKNKVEYLGNTFYDKWF